jgi:Fic family protein
MKPPYELSNRILELYGQINEALGQCNSLRLVKPEATLRKQNRIKTIHSSLAIEGNTLDIEQITAIINHVHVIGKKKDILEVQNAIKAYDILPEIDAFSMHDFLKIHSILMAGLIEQAGRFRTTHVGITNGVEVKHLAPSFMMVPSLMQDLFTYLRDDHDIVIIKSCVFHYEMEFIHPFEDGNGRMGRYWQTRLLMEAHPIFEYIPIEETIKQHQAEYYHVLAEADRLGTSTMFIEYMLNAIHETLRTMLEAAKIPPNDVKSRAVYALISFNEWFDRKAYMKMNRGISPATASRDLQYLVKEGILEVRGKGRMTQYRKR